MPDNRFGKQALKFILVGVLNTIVGAVIMFGMYNFFHFGYWVSSITNYVLTSVLSFFLNKHFTFRNKEKSFTQVLKFALNILICYGLAYGIAKPLMIHILSNQSATIKDNISMLVGMCLFTALNFLGQKFFAFNQKEKSL